VIQYGDPRARDPRTVEAKRKEIRGLLAQETFKIVSKRKVPQGANVLKGRYVLSIKELEHSTKLKRQDLSFKAIETLRRTLWFVPRRTFNTEA
jgi:hypothetical protein